MLTYLAKGQSKGKNAPKKPQTPSQPAAKKKATTKKTIQPLPSHQALMEHLANSLQVDYNQVYSGVAAEQHLVWKAGIETFQDGALFLRDQASNSYFKLRLNAQDLQRFGSYYGGHHPNLIQQVTRENATWVKVILDTKILYYDVVSTLSLHEK